MTQTEFDVVICGGGLAGLALARQLKLEFSEISVAVIDRLTAPLPEAAFKVGESSNELGTYYYGQVLQLHSYFEAKHLFKLGLRFFFGDAHGPLESRPETGADLFPPAPSYQIDRGRLENDLRQMDQEMGVVLFEGATVDRINLGDGDQLHSVHCRRIADDAAFELTGRWVVDALGRRRMLQTQLGLKRTNGHRASAAWWRYPGRVDIDDMAPSAGSEWRKRNVEARYYSTNHLMGRGYWVWLIPLSSGATSIGIVTDETIHPQHSYGRSYAQALEWLQANEPGLWAYFRNLEPLDFHSLKEYSYASAQVFSHQRWSCVGEAGFFLDPFYSIGSDFIAIGNTITVEMIRRDRAGELTEDAVRAFNRLVLEILYPICRDYYQDTYRAFGHSQIFTAKLTWDTAIYWAWMVQLFMQGLITQPTPEVFALGERYRDLNERVQRLFADWADAAPPRAIFVRGDMTRMRFTQLLGLDLASRRSQQQALEIARKNLDRFEEMAQVLFWQAVTESNPDQAARQPRPWLNAWRIRLDPAQWSEERLFEPATAPRPLGSMQDNFTGIFAPQGWREILVYEIPYRFLHMGKGFVFYRLVKFLHRLVFVKKPAMWARKWLIRDYPSEPARTEPLNNQPDLVQAN